MNKKYLKLKARRDALVAKRTQLLDEAGALLSGDGDLTEEIRSQVEAKQREAKSLVASIELVQTQLDELAQDEESRGIIAGRPDSDSRNLEDADDPEEEAPPTAGETRTRVESVPERNVPGINAARYVIALAASQRQLRTGRLTAASTIAEQRWGRQHPVTRALSVSDFASGGALMPDAFSMEFIELLRPASIFDALGPTPGSIVNGKLSAPGMTGGAVAAFMDEGSKIPKTEQTFGRVEDTVRKIGCHVPLNNEWLMNPTAQFEEMIRTDMLNAVAQTIDIACIRSDGTAGEVKGLRYWAASGSLIPFNASVSLANTRSDLGKMTLKLRKAKKGRLIKPAWILGPTAYEYLDNLADGNGNLVYANQLDGGKLKRYPYQVCDQLPENLGAGNESEAYLVDMADIVKAMDNQLRVESTSEGSFTDAGNQQVNAWENDMTLIRVIGFVGLIARRPEAIVVGTGVTWAPQ